MTMRKAHFGLAIILAILTLVAVFLGNQRQAYAQSLAEDILCQTYAELQAAGAPIPPELESACGGGNGGGGGGVDPVDPCTIFDELGNLPPECDDDGGGEEPPVDVCPNIEGVQETVPEGKVLENGQCVDAPGNGGGNGDGDGGTGGSGAGGSGGGGCPPYANPCTGGVNTGSGGGLVLGTTTAATTTPVLPVPAATTTEAVISCDMYLTDFIKAGAQNNVEQVKRLQSVLKNNEKADVEINGEYDTKTLAAVHALQTKYASEILTPWGVKESTGFVYLTTRKKINELYCKSTKQFPLSESEQKLIEKARSGASVPIAAPVTKPAPAPKPVVEAPITITGKTVETTREEPAATLPGNNISNFFRRLFDRFR